MSGECINNFYTVDKIYVYVDNYNYIENTIVTYTYSKYLS
jgi:hypothetical protein